MHDVIVLGLGAMGSATLFELAKRGVRTLGVDRFETPHAHGSTHGESRIIRQAYFEGAFYVPLVKRAYALWEELERGGETPLFRRSGGLFFGRETSDVVLGSIRSAERFDLEHEVLTGAEMRRRFPPLTVPDDCVGLYEPAAGVLAPEACVAAFRSQAIARGAEIADRETALGWHAGDDQVEVRTTAGRYRARSLVLALGAWLPRFLEGWRLPLEIRRLAMYWFRPPEGTAPFRPDRFPVYIGESLEGPTFYGFPAMAGDEAGVKIAFHDVSRPSDPDAVDRTIAPEEEEAMRGMLRHYLPSLDGPLVRAATCLYTLTPDEHFVIDRHPASSRVVVASCCSGHGFKFASAIGEALASLALDEPPPVDIDAFGASRFGDLEELRS